MTTVEQLQARVVELEAENTRLVARLDWIEGQLQEAWEHATQADSALVPGPDVVPARRPAAALGGLATAKG